MACMQKFSEPRPGSVGLRMRLANLGRELGLFGSYGSSWESPRFPLEGSFKGDRDIAMDTHVDMDIKKDIWLLLMTLGGPVEGDLGFP